MFLLTNKWKEYLENPMIFIIHYRLWARAAYSYWFKPTLYAYTIWRHTTEHDTPRITISYVYAYKHDHKEEELRPEPTLSTEKKEKEHEKDERSSTSRFIQSV